MILPAIVMGMQLVMPVQNIPKLDVNRSCRAEAVGTLGTQMGVESCVKSEQEARNQISKSWSTFAAGDRSTCVGLSNMGGQSTYIELLTCLEIMRDSRKLPKDVDTTIGRARR